jgi:hypothetical protein
MFLWWTCGNGRQPRTEKQARPTSPPWFMKYAQQPWRFPQANALLEEDRTSRRNASSPHHGGRTPSGWQKIDEILNVLAGSGEEVLTGVQQPDAGRRRFADHRATAAKQNGAGHRLRWCAAGVKGSGFDADHLRRLMINLLTTPCATSAGNKAIEGVHHRAERPGHLWE